MMASDVSPHHQHRACWWWLVFALVTGETFAQARLTELQPLNTNGPRDQGGALQPWIELWNPSPSTVLSVANYRLVHDGFNWVFPAIRIMPDERIVVFASGQDQRVPTAPLHTNFTLNPAGGTLELRHSNGSVLSVFNYPALSPGVSWGRDEWDTAVTPGWTGVYDTPTPGERNSLRGAAIAGAVVFDQPSQAFLGTLTVSLSQAAPEAGTEIRYTTDKSVPTAASSLYEGPITVNATRMVRARVFKPGLLPGPTATQAYLQLNATTRNFSTRIPLAVLSSFSTTAPPADGDQEAFLWLWEPDAEGRAAFADPPTLTARVAINRRGSSTLGNPKLNFNVQVLNEADNDGRDVALLGMAAHDDWVFHAPYDFDRALLRNPLMYQLSRSIGRYAAGSRMAEVFIDVTGGSLNFTGSSTSASDYFGVYNLMERLRRNKDRIDLRKLESYDHTGSALTGGYIWKVDRLGTGETGFRAGGQALTYYYPRERDLKSPQRAPQAAYLIGYINDFYAALTGPEWKSPDTGYAAWLEVPSVIDSHLLNLWAYNVDAFRLSTFWQKDADGKIAAGPIWDFDRSLSSTDTGYEKPRDENPVEWGNGRWPEGGFFAAHWWNRLFQDIDFYQRYIDRWQELRRGPFAEARVNALVDSLNEAIGASAVSRDLNRWQRAKRPWTGPHARNPVTRASQDAEIQRIKDYLQVRAEFFDSQWVGPVTPSVPTGAVAAGTPITLSGPPGVPIYYTVNGFDPRPSGGGAPVAAARLWDGEPIVIDGRTVLRARAYDATHTALSGGNLNPPLVSHWGGLSELLYTHDPRAAAGDLVISELNFNPFDPTPAEAALNPAWENNSFEFIELYNRTSTPLDLGGVAFTAGITYTFPDDGMTRVPSGGLVIVASDPLAFAARYGTAAIVFGPWSGNLSNGGETLTLRAADGTVIQSLTYSDNWQPATDKGGFTLVAYDLDAEAAAFSTAANWRASQAPGGSPGAPDPHSAPRGHLTAAAWIAVRPHLGGLDDDFDHDGRSNLFEFAFLTDPEAPEADPPPHVEWTDGRPAFVFLRRPPASGLIYQLEISTDLQTFRSVTVEEYSEEIIRTDATGDLVRLRPTFASSAAFYRLRITSIP